jgi:pimeloyl-ACP methyl ester carboxylesterase
MLHYSKTGKGSVVVLLHGFGEDSIIWQHQINHLQSSYQLLVPDVRGSGGSAYLSPAFSIEHMAEDVIEVLKHEQIDNCTIIGHSMGGYIALALVEKYPNYFNGIGLVHSTSYADSEEKKLARSKSIEFIKENTAAEFIKATIPNLFGDAFKKEHSKEVEELIERGNQFTKEHLIAYYNAMKNRPDRTHVIQQTNIPVLYFIGSEDKAVNPADALQQSSVPSICSVQLVKGIAHMGMLEATARLNKTLDDFLKLVQQNNLSHALMN